jgi:hypothetical protein
LFNATFTPVRQIWTKYLYLIGHCNKNSQQEEVAAPPEVALHFLLWQSQEVPHHTSQKWYRQHKVVAVGFNEVMPCDGSGIQVVLSERPNEVLQASVLVNQQE